MQDSCRTKTAILSSVIREVLIIQKRARKNKSRLRPTWEFKTFFCSNVCAMYRRSIYEKLGGFVKHTIFNEDMIFAEN